jgi:SAM-dependent methyltransferase
VTSTEFWAKNQVGGPYENLKESQKALLERQRLYPALLDLMPVVHPGKTILDYGCGPGHDTLLFCLNGAGHVFYYDISPLALEILDMRLELHAVADYASPTDMFWLPPVDHIHCAGVLHHMEDPMQALRLFRRALKPDGEVRVMIYDGDRSRHTQSKVPITNWWTAEEFGAMALTAGFSEEWMGSYECSAPWRPGCYAACYRLTCLRS